MDGITLLKDDHRTVEKLFKDYEKAGAKAFKTKEKIVAAIIKELSVHAAIEEQVFYPAARSEVTATNGEVLEAIEEHHIVKWELSELQGMAADAEAFDAKVSVLMENVRHHVEEEETDLFPQIREALGRKRLGEIGDALDKARKLAPTSPHPRSPSTPPGNLVAAPIAKAVDKLLDR
jgi:hemerythrin superfamily protein